MISARATQDLSSFNLDLRGFAISRLLVDGRAATFTRDGGQELTVTPRTGIRAGTAFTVTIDYAGTPAVVTDPGRLDRGLGADGRRRVRRRTSRRARPAWYPCNDNPRDKATFDFRVTVPAGLTALANGVLVSTPRAVGRRPGSGARLTRWRRTSRQRRSGSSTRDLQRREHPIVRRRRPETREGAGASKLREVVRFYESIYGPYPFNAVGAIVDDAKGVGYSLETQTKPNFPSVPDELTLVHELSHMWFGDSVTLVKWPDIWLHEGFATWSEWIWSERQGNKSAAQYFEQSLEHPRKQTRSGGLRSTTSSTRPCSSTAPYTPAAP